MIEIHSSGWRWTYHSISDVDIMISYKLTRTLIRGFNHIPNHKGFAYSLTERKFL